VHPLLDHQPSRYLTSLDAGTVGWEAFGQFGGISGNLTYDVAVGSCQCCNDIRDFVRVSPVAAQVPTPVRGTVLMWTTIVANLQLLDGSTIFYTVRGTNVIGKSVTGCSLQVSVDSTAPFQGAVFDGDLERDVDFQATDEYVFAQ